MYARMIALAAACLLSVYGSGQVKFKRISVHQGLSQSTVYTMIQDRQGYIWAGTGDGLNRYDGYRFDVYRHIEGDSLSLGSNKVLTSFIDSSHNLWVGTSTCLSVYNRDTDTFSNYNFLGQNLQIFDIDEISPGRLIVVGDAGIMSFDVESRTFGLILSLENARNKHICRYGDDMIIGSSTGLYLYSGAENKVSRILPQLAQSDITDVVYTPGEGLWIATFGGGLYRTDERLQVTARYTRTAPADCGLTTDYLRVLERDHQGRLWVGSIEGLFLYEDRTGRFTRYTYSPDDDTSLSHNSVRSILIDNQQGIWIGTFYGGLNYYHPLVFRFGNYHHTITGNSLNDNTVSCITEERGSENLWIGTNDGGLNRYDATTGRFTSWPTGRNGLRSGNIKCILEDSLGNIYVGTHAGGLSYLDRRTGALRNYRINTLVPVHNSCYSLLDNGDGTLWVGALNGLYLLDKKTGTLRPNPAAMQMSELMTADVFTMLRDGRGRIWMGTNKGVFLYDTATGRVSVPQNNWAAIRTTVYNLAEDSRGDIWAGCDRGLLRFDAQSLQSTAYTTLDGLPNANVNAIAEDATGRLWLSTNKGISCFDLRAGTFRNYNLSDRAGNEQFIPNSVCRSRSGMIYFGGINGLTYFNPSQLGDNPYSPAPIITGVRLFNKDVAHDSNVVMTKDEKGNNVSVRFPSWYSVFSFYYVVINPIASGNNLFSYTLKGFDNQWYETTNRGVNYSNLPPGKYTFMLRAANNDGIWSQHTTSFDVYITPQWYQTAVARLAFILLGLGLAFLIVRFYLERVDKRRIEQMSQEKVRFYINLSHELRTPLTLILSPLEEIKDQTMENRYVASRIEIVRRNAGKLLHMVNQMLDFRKAESGILKLQIAPQNIRELADEVFLMFEPAAHNRDIDYLLDVQLENATYPVDRLFVERILVNLISNAFKFTPDSGRVSVSAGHQGDSLVLQVGDNGRGLSPGDRERIFERFYKVDESRPGTGIGLSIVKKLIELHHGTIEVESAPGEGTCFIVRLPADAKGYAKSEMRDQTEPGPASPTLEPALYLEQSNERLPGVADDPGGADREETLLVVDDNEEIRRYLGEFFSSRFRVLSASDGEQALAMIHRSNPDLVITDLTMAGMDGLRLVQTLKQNIRTSHIPVIVLSARDTMEDKLTGMAAGADDYMTKPFSPALLNSKVTNLLKSKYRLLNYYSRSTTVEPEKITQNAVDGEFLRKAIGIVKQNMANVAFSADDFCSAMHMSRTSLHLKMRAITGESTTHFIRKIRLEHACALLSEGVHTITEISELTGFNTPSYFTSTFKKHMGCLPTEYGKQKKNPPQTPQE